MWKLSHTHTSPVRPPIRSRLDYITSNHSLSNSLTGPVFKTMGTTKLQHKIGSFNHCAFIILLLNLITINNILMFIVLMFMFIDMLFMFTVNTRTICHLGIQPSSNPLSQKVSPFYEGVGSIPEIFKIYVCISLD
jgi:hypothetical protein